MNNLDIVTISTSSLDYYIEIVATWNAKTITLWYQPEFADACGVPLKLWFDETESGTEIDMTRSFLYYNKNNIDNDSALVALAFSRANEFVNARKRLREIWEEEWFNDEMSFLDIDTYNL